MTSTTSNNRLEEKQTEGAGRYPSWQAGKRRSVSVGEYTYAVNSFFYSDTGKSVEDAILSTLFSTKRTVARYCQ